MNLKEVAGPLRAVSFRAWRSLVAYVPSRRIQAFGGGAGQIGAILVVNLDRQPKRWRRVFRELRRFKTSGGAPLTSLTRRLAAIDARDGRAVAATADVDAMYRIADQLYVLPDSRLAECFAGDEPVRMSRQELAVARSHVEAWKTISSGTDEYVLVLEDDVWFAPGAASVIDRGWKAAIERCSADGGPKLLYLSYYDAGKMAIREEVCDLLFRPARGLLFLSGYVLSRKGAEALLRAMPVVGPVDLWINRHFSDLGALALTSPVIAQRHDGGSDNSYSVLPFLARAGVVDSEHAAAPPDLSRTGPVLAWTREAGGDDLAMALSMIGLRVRVFDDEETPMDKQTLERVLALFDALVDPPLLPSAMGAVERADPVILLEAGSRIPASVPRDRRSATLAPGDKWSWGLLCGVLGVVPLADAFPAGSPRDLGLFRVARHIPREKSDGRARRTLSRMDESPWVLPLSSGWRPSENLSYRPSKIGRLIFESGMTTTSESLSSLGETFPGNLASFDRGQIRYSDQGAELIIDAAQNGVRPYRSGAFASTRAFIYGRVEAEIRAALGSGLVTGFFLHRGAPRQEIDIEFAGTEPDQMLVNVYFNPGDEGAALEYGYRGSPWRIALGFDATADFHHYAIEWRHDRIVWMVDHRVVHERVGWDPTPIPHLGMRLHGNLWAPRSEELAGRVDRRSLPARAVFRNVRVTA